MSPDASTFAPLNPGLSHADLIRRLYNLIIIELASILFRSISSINSGLVFGHFVSFNSAILALTPPLFETPFFRALFTPTAGTLPICRKCNLGRAGRAAEVEAQDLDVEVYSSVVSCGC